MKEKKINPQDASIQANLEQTPVVGESNGGVYPPHPVHPTNPPVTTGVPTALKSTSADGILVESTGVYDRNFNAYLDELLLNIASKPPYFCISNASTASALTVKIQKFGNPDALKLEYSADGFSWSPLLSSVGIAPAVDGNYKSIYLRNNTNKFSKDLNNYYKITFSNANAYCSGKISSLLNYATLPTSTPAYSFAHLFEGSNVPDFSGIEMPTNGVGAFGYCYMFANNPKLIATPLLPAISVGQGAYSHMFEGCTSLEVAPTLPATNLTASCYKAMFKGCTSLLSVPQLAGALVNKPSQNSNNCYANMFEGCTSLITPPALTSETLAEGCYREMFKDCTSLVNAPKLPARVLAKDCYTGMYSGCTSLQTIICLAEQLGDTNPPVGTNTKDWALGVVDPGDPQSISCIFYKSAGISVFNPAQPKADAWLLDSTSGVPTNWEVKDYGSVFAKEVIFEREYDKEEIDPVTGEVVTTHIDTGYESTDVQAVIEEISDNTRVLVQGIAELDDRKQDRLIEGEGVSLENNVLSVTAEKYRSACVKFTDLSGMENALTVSTTATTAHNVLLECSKNGTDWVSFQPNEDIVFPANGTLYIRNRSGVWTGNGKTYKISCIHEFAVAGDLYALLDYRNPEAPLYLNCFNALFNVSVSQNNCVDASNLRFPTYTADNAMAKMFQYNQKLVVAPKLPATFLSRFCYESMFAYCTSLVVPPLELPARNLEQSCYDSMFNGCTSLTYMPEIMAKALASQCMNKMFMNCKALTEIPDSLPATTLAQTCYSQMFQGCISLTHAPQLPAETLALQCYYRMFYGCTSLVESPILPAKELVQNCYTGMFQGCTSLKKITAYADLFHNTTKIGVNTVSWVTNVPEGGVFCKGKDAKVTTTATPIKEAWLKDSVDGIPLHWRIEDAEDNKERVIAQALAELKEFKQDKLVAGENITLEHNTISAKTNTTELQRVIAQALAELKEFKADRFQVGEGLTYENNVLEAKQVKIDELERVLSQAIAELATFKQDRLVAGEGITLENNTISAKGAGDVTHEEFEQLQRVTAQGMAQLDREKMPRFTTGDGLSYDWEANVLEMDGELDTETLEQVIAQGFHQLDTEKENRIVAGEGVDVDRRGGQTVISVSGQATDNQVIAQALAQLERTKQPVLTALPPLKIDHGVISIVTNTLDEIIEKAVETKFNTLLQKYGLIKKDGVMSDKLKNRLGLK